MGAVFGCTLSTVSWMGPLHAGHTAGLAPRREQHWTRRGLLACLKLKYERHAYRCRKIEFECCVADSQLRSSSVTAGEFFACVDNTPIKGK